MFSLNILYLEKNINQKVQVNFYISVTSISHTLTIYITVAIM